MCIRDRSLRKKNFDFLASGQVSHLCIVELGFDAKSVQKSSSIRLCLPSVHLCEFTLKFAGTEDVYKRQVLYGPDPNKLFCGSPYDEESYGIYARGLQKALAKAAGDHYEFLDETGTSTETLLKKYIDQDMPVVFWACINMRKEIPGPEWKLLDTGERFCWTSNEHCMLLVGYDEEKYYFNDPYDNNGVVGYPTTPLLSYGSLK